MTYVLRLMGDALGQATPWDGQFLKAYDPEAETWEWTPLTEAALHFTDAGAALSCWKQVSRVRPVRRDGKPNRPLTQFTVEVFTP